MRAARLSSIFAPVNDIWDIGSALDEPGDKPNAEPAAGLVPSPTRGAARLKRPRLQNDAG
jgi:hypothetical protein